MIFISLEGIDGSGKTTIAKIVKEKILEKGYDVILTREPGGEEISEAIRKLILDKNNTSMTHWTEALLYIASRKQHVDRKIIPALKSGKVVICDRFMDSTTVYQGYARGIGMAEIDQVQNVVIGSAKPDLTIFFDINPKEAQIRLTSRVRSADRLDLEDEKFHQVVYEGYQLLISNNTDRIKVVDARKSVNEVVQQVEFLILEALEERLKKS
ncbi:thymidylate kinase [Spiroplasma sabaudiense Ar-1343]|uniref:Thymidylate kinase n=1 Tax=Spiroplasma sabaudiense Ar-1343 TaxID=1276257 RepID=W6A8X9_9MOLU|nr:dTMP kinase [Spiroplasma sabaudiense]AHI53421.1 thymidylate kinase [Spiroplasma sabaudiense Ar-1343]